MFITFLKRPLAVSWVPQVFQHVSHMSSRCLLKFIKICPYIKWTKKMIQGAILETPGALRGSLFEPSWGASVAASWGPPVIFDPKLTLK